MVRDRIRPNAMIRIGGALLLGGALLASSACTRQQVSFLPGSVPPALDPLDAQENAAPRGKQVRVGGSAFQQAEPDPIAAAAPEDGLLPVPDSAPPEPPDAVPGIDEPTGLPNEIGLGGETRPEGRQRIPEMPPLLFEFGGAQISADQREFLRPHVAFLKANPQFHVVLRGHTDDVGTADFNLALGQSRASAVRSAMIDMGIEPARLTTMSMGMDAPRIPGRTEAARRQNRRVEFFLFEKED